MRKSQSSVLDYLVTFLQEKFRDHEAPELPDEHLEPSYDLVRERIVHTVDQFGDKLKTCRGDRRPFFRLAEMLAHYLAILSVYTRRNRYRSDNHPAKEMFEDVAPLVRRLHHNKLNLLDEELSRVSEGAEHRVTPPEILISKRAQNTADTKG